MEIIYLLYTKQVHSESIHTVTQFRPLKYVIPFLTKVRSSKDGWSLGIPSQWFSVKGWMIFWRDLQEQALSTCLLFSLTVATTCSWAQHLAAHKRPPSFPSAVNKLCFAFHNYLPSETLSWVPAFQRKWDWHITKACKVAWEGQMIMVDTLTLSVSQEDLRWRRSWGFLSQQCKALLGRNMNP